MIEHVRLIVNADDYGLTPGVSTGIREAHLRGIVTCTTAMMVFAQVETDLQAAQEQCPKLGLGVHLVVSEYTPLRPRANVRTLTGTDGQFHTAGVVFGANGRALLAHMDTVELRDEWRAQIERFLALQLPIDHLDCHHHLAYQNEAMFDVLLGLAREYATPIRVPVDACFTSDRSGWTLDPGGEFGWLVSRLPPIDMPHPDGFIGNFYDATATAAQLLETLDLLSSGTFELMCHPGHVDAALPAITSYHAPRAGEIAALTDARVQALIREQGIELITFAQI